MSREIEAKAFACDTCGRVHTTLIYAARLDISTQAAQRAADECCQPRVCECGEPVERPWTACAPCRERNKLLRAMPIDAASYSGPVHSDDCDGEWGEGYSSDLDALREWCADWEAPVPAYVHPCDEETFALDAGQIIESALDDHHDDGADQVVDEEGLEAFLKEWNAKQTLRSCFPDTKRVIVLDQERFDALIAPLAAMKDGDADLLDAQRAHDAGRRA